MFDSGGVLIQVVGTEAFLPVLCCLPPSLPFTRIYQVPECARASWVVLVVKNLPSDAGDLRD